MALYIGPKLYIDCETRSTLDLRKTGVYPYAEHSSTDVWCLCWAIDDADVATWRPGEPVPLLLVEHVQAGHIVFAHNAGFELAIWAGILAPRYGFPELRVGQTHCTAAMAAALALPRKLGDVARILELPVQKDDAGHRLMLQMSRPRAGMGHNGGPVWWGQPEKRERLEAYCVDDVRTEREVQRKLPMLSDRERAIWLLDWRINNRGVTIDRRLVRRAMGVANVATARLNAELSELTDGEVTAVSRVAAMGNWLTGRGVPVENLAKKAVRKLLGELDADLAPVERRVLEIRRQGAKTSTAKLSAFLLRSSADGRMRENLLYFGASTGRWAGKGAQLQNLPRPRDWFKYRDVLAVLDELRTLPPAPSLDELSSVTDMIELVWGSPMEALADCIRSMIVAARGHEFITADFANIEGRVVAWLAGHTALVEAFRADGKIYEMMAAAIFGVPLESISKDGIERFLGKQVVLGCGYGMGPPKFIEHCDTVAGVEIDLELATRSVEVYRAENKEIVDLWSALADAAMEAVRHPGKKFEAVTYSRATGVVYLCAHRNLYCKLPSGRILTYAHPRIEMAKTPWGELRPTITYMGVNSLTKQWSRQKTYGGRLAENVVQALARDLLAEAMLRCEGAGYPIVLSVHDELVAEVPIGSGDLKQFEELMAELPPWAAGLPVRADGWRGNRYRK